MNTQSNPPHSKDHGISLQRIVDGLLSDTQQIASMHCSAVVNEIGMGMYLQAANSRIICLFEEIVQTVISNSEEGDIRIGAERNGDKLTLKIQERNNNNGYALSFSLGSLMHDVSTAGGDLMIVGHQKRVTTIYFSFTDKKVA
jgi:hypothetical protein